MLVLQATGADSQTALQQQHPRIWQLPEISTRTRTACTWLEEFCLQSQYKKKPQLSQITIHVFSLPKLCFHTVVCASQPCSRATKGGFPRRFQCCPSFLRALPARLGRRDVLPSRTERQKALVCDPRARVTKPCSRLTPTPHPLPREHLRNVLRALRARSDQTPATGSPHKVKHNVLATAQMR